MRPDHLKKTLLILGLLASAACGQEVLDQEELGLVDNISEDEQSAEEAGRFMIDKEAVIDNIIDHVRLTRLIDANFDGDFDTELEEFITIVDLNKDGVEDELDLEEAKSRVRKTINRNNIPYSFLLKLAYSLDQSVLKVKQLDDGDAHPEKAEQVVAYETYIFVSPNQGGLYADAANGILGDGSGEHSTSTSNGFFNGPFLGVWSGDGDTTLTVNDRGRYDVLIHEFVHVVFRYLETEEKLEMVESIKPLQRYFRAPANVSSPEETICSAFAQVTRGGDFRSDLEVSYNKLTKLEREHYIFANENGLRLVEDESEDVVE